MTRRGTSIRVRRRRPRPRRLQRMLRVGAVLAAAAVVVPVAPVWLLARVPPPTSAYMIRAHFADPASGESCERIEYAWVDRERIASDLRLAVVLAEDQRFLLHDGFDLRSLRRALQEREAGRIRGASTLTQQVAKNLFLWPGQSYLRKGIEAWLALWIEQLWTKQRILEVYLNVAQFGPCVFGAGAASERYFEVAAADLTPEQAALLATVLPNPHHLRVHDPGPYARERRAEILELMATQRGHAHLRGL
jgi:monofunctional biosynthetic peptidoglycan transglycosylase